MVNVTLPDPHRYTHRAPIVLEAENAWEAEHLSFLFPGNEIIMGTLGQCPDCTEAIYEILEACRKAKRRRRAKGA